MLPGGLSAGPHGNQSEEMAYHIPQLAERLDLDF